MNLRYIFDIISPILKYLSVIMLIPCICALILGENSAVPPYLYTSVIIFALSLMLKRKETTLDDIDNMTRAEGLTIVLISWLIFSLLSAIPFVFFGLSPIDALFESVSGITTTGATILPDFSLYPQTMFFWRSFSQWLGGMGILVLFIAILPKLAVAGRQMFIAESPGASSTESKLTPRIRQTAAALWGIYIILTIIEFCILIHFGMPVFDSLCTSLSTVSGGGFSPSSTSLMNYCNYKCIWTIAVFMFLSGTNFALQYKIYTKFNFKALFKDDEFKAYFRVVLFFTVIIAITLTTHHIYDFKTAVETSLFHVISIITTTGFAYIDYEQWNLRAKLLLFLLMFSGASIGSASGGLKLLRLVFIFKYLKRQISKIYHPNGVYPIKINRAIVNEDVVKQIVSFVFFYYIIFAVTAGILVFTEQNITLGVSAAITTLGNVGPAFGAAGPLGNFSELTICSKIICIFNMLIGRLELIPFLAVLHPDFWCFKNNCKIKERLIKVHK